MTQKRFLHSLVLALAALVPSVLLGPGVPAFAHAQLLVSSPAVSQSFKVAPTVVSLQFDDDLINLPSGNQIVVLDPLSSHVETGAVKLAGATLSVALKKLTSYGKYQVLYHVVSADGHPVSGSYFFYLDKPVPTPAPKKVTSKPKAPVKAPVKKASLKK